MLTTILREAKANYHRDLLKVNQGNAKTINSILGRNQHTNIKKHLQLLCNDKSTPNKLNEHFSSQVAQW